MSPSPWQTGHLIQAQYLNSLQELLSDWGDNVLLEASGPAVVVPATPSAPAALVVDGHMRTNTSNKHATVSGPSGIYNIFATADRGTGEFRLSATPTQVVAAHSRPLGVAHFNGSVVTKVESRVREVNVSHLMGHQVSETPASQSIPAGREDGTLHPGWIDDLEYNMVPIGGVRELWVPSGVNAASMIPSGWALLNGQTIPAGQHGFPIGGPVTLPDMRNRFSLGANPNAAAGSAGNDSGVAPGIRGVGGSNAARNLSHTHSGGGHSHFVHSHQHQANHKHFFSTHRHTLTQSQRRWSPGTSGHPNVATSLIVTDGFTLRTVSYSAPPDAHVPGGSPTHLESSTFVGLTSAAVTNTGGMIGGAVVTAPLNTNDFTPRFVGMVYMMRVL